MNEDEGRTRSTQDVRERRRTAREQLKTRGEAAVAAYLDRQGFRIAAVRWECPAGRIDLIAWDGLDLVLIDVVTRRAPKTDADVKPVSDTKKRRLKRIATSWLIANEACPRQVRFDVITLLVIAEDRALLRHLRSEYLIQP